MLWYPCCFCMTAHATLAVAIVIIYIGIIRLFDRLNCKSQTNIAITVNALLSLILYKYLICNNGDIIKREKGEIINFINDPFDLLKLLSLLIPLIVSKCLSGDWYIGNIDYTFVIWLIIVNIHSNYTCFY